MAIYEDGKTPSQQNTEKKDEHVETSSGVHGVTGDIVGDTDEQVLSSKTVDGANNTIILNSGDTLPS